MRRAGGIWRGIKGESKKNDSASKLKSTPWRSSRGKLAKMGAGTHNVCFTEWTGTIRFHMHSAEKRRSDLYRRQVEKG